VLGVLLALVLEHLILQFKQEVILKKLVVVEVLVLEIQVKFVLFFKVGLGQI
jgi:hypothetical protein